MTRTEDMVRMYGEVCKASEAARILERGTTMMAMRWTDDKLAQLREMAQAGKTAAEAAERFGVKRGTINAVSSRNDIRWPRAGAVTCRRMRAGTPFYEARQAMGLTQIEAADEIGCSEASVKNWETGRRRPQRYWLKRAARAYGVTTEYLLTQKVMDVD